MKDIFDKLRRFLFSALVTNAALINVGFIFFVCGIPITSKIIIAKNYWHGPMILTLAVAIGFWIQLTSEKKTTS